MRTEALVRNEGHMVSRRRTDGAVVGNSIDGACRRPIQLKSSKVARAAFDQDTCRFRENVQLLCAAGKTTTSLSADCCPVAPSCGPE